MSRYVLHFQTDKPASSAASIHIPGCRHANLRPRVVSQLTGESKADVMKSPEIDDLLARGWAIRFAPCTLKEAK